MQHKCKVTVIDKKCFADYQRQYLADSKSGPCPFYQVGDTFLFERYGEEDTFWRMGCGSQCAEAWDCISRYIYTALQGGSIMRNWTNDERMMIACCNDGTRPVIFKIARQDYKVVHLEGMVCEKCAQRVREALEAVAGVERAEVKLAKGWAEVFPARETEVSDDALCAAVSGAGYTVTKVN